MREPASLEAILADLDQLSELNAQLRAMLMRARLPFYFVRPDETPDEPLARAALAESLVRMNRFPETDETTDEVALPAALSGVLCIDDTARAQIEIVNTLKQRIKAEVVAFKQNGRQQKDFLNRVAPSDAGVFEVFSQMPPGERIDWWRTYAQIRILPPTIESVSFTWAKSHSQIIRYEYEQVLETALALKNEPTRERVLARLGQIGQSTPLLLKRTQRPQLRANLVSNIGGERVRSSTPVSGVLVVAREHLPRVVYHSPRKEERLERFDRKLSDEPLIPELSLYTYRGL